MQELAAARSARDDLARRLADVVAERDELSKQLIRCVAERETALQKHTAVRIVLDRLFRELRIPRAIRPVTRFVRRMRERATSLVSRRRTPTASAAATPESAATPREIEEALVTLALRRQP